MTNLHGIIFAYHSNDSLGKLAKPRNTCSLPYGGRYRLIDFMLSNMVNAGISDIGLIVHENYQSLLDHVGSGKDWDLSRKRGGLRILPPFSTEESAHRVYSGTLDALSGVSTYLSGIRQEHVVLAWGDMALNIPLAEVYRQHIERGSDVTMVCSDRHHGVPSATQYLTTTDDGRVIDVLTFPSTAPEAAEFLSICILSKALLLELIEDCATHDVHTFTRGALQPRLGELNIHTYTHTGYVARFDSVRDYYDRSMDLLNPAVRRQLFLSDAPIRTKDRSDPSTYYSPDSRVTNSLIADGCVIEGEVENSIIFRGVVVEKGARVRNCILMQGTTIKSGADIAYAIADKNVRVETGHCLLGNAAFPIAIDKNSIV